MKEFGKKGRSSEPFQSTLHCFTAWTGSSEGLLVELFNVFPSFSFEFSLLKDSLKFCLFIPYQF